MKRDTINYLAVGGFVLAMLFLLMAALFRITGRTADTEPYYVLYREISGIHSGSKVTFAGFQVGQVKEIKPHRENGEILFRVKLAVKDGWEIPADSIARIVMPGVLSEKQIDILPGAGSEILAPGGMIRGSAGGDLLAVMTSLAHEIKDLSENNIKPLVKTFSQQLITIGESLTVSLPKLTDNLNFLIVRLNDTAAQLSAMMSDENRSHLNSVIRNADTVSTNLARLTADFNEASSQVDQILEGLSRMVSENDEEVNQAVSDLRSSLRTVAQHVGTIVYNLESTARNMNEFSREIRENPGLILRGSAAEKQEE
jgi:phospholipid/cholesterol/gamma-HCH transport system substrate-binding protein